MIKSIIAFYCIIIFYHIISIIVLHNRWYEHINILAGARDLWRLIIIATAIIYHYKAIIPFIKRWGAAILRAAATIITSILISYQQGSGLYDIVIGIKYGFMFLWIALSSIFIGYNIEQKQITHREKILPKIITIIILLWLCRQMAKYIRPDIFFQIWYGPIGDFIFWQEPPIYYRTWPWGDPRLQWLFAWPNNYWYFLAWFTPILLAYYQNRKNKNQKIISISIIILIALSIILTLSRTAIIGAIVWTILLYRNTMRQNKKILIAIILTTITAIAWLSILKWSSTREHITQKTSSIKYIIEKPLWYGLWTAGPAIHHNGEILPENYYMQIAIDTGIVGFLLLIITLATITRKYLIITQKIKPYVIGTAVLFVMWFFLHVFEDSMVNYLFFIPRWIYIWYYSKSHKKTIPNPELKS
jgi:hypothetical protein